MQCKWEVILTILDADRHVRMALYLSPMSLGISLLNGGQHAATVPFPASAMRLLASGWSRIELVVPSGIPARRRPEEVLTV
jgi:hypothetical protein